MKRLIIIFILVCFLSAASFAQSRDLGVGIIIGEPTGISLKHWVDNEVAIDGALAWSLDEDDTFHIHADYLLHRYDFFNQRGIDGKVPVYYGAGGRLKLRDDDKRGDDDDDVFIGIRFPLGVSYMIPDTYFDVFLEIVPVFDIYPDTDIDLEAAFGGRYYFWGKKFILSKTIEIEKYLDKGQHFIARKEFKERHHIGVSLFITLLPKRMI